MDFHVESWLAELTGRIRGVFGARLIYVGHTGSYARGEAKETSDIDVNVVLDELRMEDLKMYRKIIQSMPNSEKMKHKRFVDAACIVATATRHR